mmetsp:Transcript_4026/g.7975  ORF Transcript_4026/g.7975 Transcript_4026/m.7975 type:complete len:98 (+) Transcript_4026:137-430(+)
MRRLHGNFQTHVFCCVKILLFPPNIAYKDNIIVPSFSIARYSTFNVKCLSREKQGYDFPNSTWSLPSFNSQSPTKPHCFPSFFSISILKFPTKCSIL